MTKLLKICLVTLSLAFSPFVFAGEAEDAIAAAKAAQKTANEVGGEWRDTGKMIKKAEKLLAEGKPEKAIAEARKAEAQGMLGYMQATTQKELHI